MAFDTSKSLARRHTCIALTPLVHVPEHNTLPQRQRVAITTTIGHVQTGEYLIVLVLLEP